MSTFIFVEKIRRFVVREFVKLSDEFDIYLLTFFSQLSPNLSDLCNIDNAVVLSALFLTRTFLDLQTFTSIFTNFLQAQDLFLIALILSYCMFNDFFLSFSEGAKLRQK